VAHPYQRLTSRKSAKAGEEKACCLFEIYFSFVALSAAHHITTTPHASFFGVRFTLTHHHGGTVGVDEFCLKTRSIVLIRTSLSYAYNSLQ
jgi:hypothetical protein